MKKLSIKKFIKEFSFPEPDWTSLPEGFPKLNKTGLTRQEGHLLDGIKLAWVVSDGRDYFIKTVARRAFVGAAIIILVLLGKTIVSSPDKNLTRSVSAKTVGQTFGDFVEATMSAVFKK